MVSSPTSRVGAILLHLRALSNAAYGADHLPPPIVPDCSEAFENLRPDPGNSMHRACVFFRSLAHSQLASNACCQNSSDEQIGQGRTRPSSKDCDPCRHGAPRTAHTDRQTTGHGQPFVTITLQQKIVTPRTRKAREPERYAAMARRPKSVQQKDRQCKAGSVARPVLFWAAMRFV